MITIMQGPVNSRLVGELDPDTLDKIDQDTTFMYAGAEFMPKVREMMWDGTRHLFSRKTFTFPTGLTDRICDILQARSIPYCVQPSIIIKPKTIHVPELRAELRDYQREALQRTMLKNRGIIRIATGGGKTLCYAGIIAQKKVPTIILVHKKELLYQTRLRLEKDLGIPLEDIGIIGDGHKEYKDISVAMLQTLMYNFGIVSKEFTEKDDTKIDIKEVDRFNMLIADEVHIIGSKTFYNVSKVFKNTIYRYGGSATPIRTDGFLLVESAIGPIIYSKTIGELKGKYLADVDIYFFKYAHAPAPKHLAYKDLYMKEVVQNQERNELIKNLVEKCGEKKVLIAVRNVEHGNILKNLIPNAVFIHGSLSTKVRQTVLDQFEQGHIKRLISTVIMEQGVDIPSLETLIDVRAEKSAIGFIQLIGRVMRKTDIKNRAVVIDIYDYGCRWLSSHARERIEIATQEIGEVHLVNK